jgi:hypothetical protein
MGTTSLIINKLGLKNKEARELIINTINSQIVNYNLEYLSQWEGDHSTTAASKDKKIEIIANKKIEVIEYFNKYHSSNSQLNINLSIEVKEIITNAELSE